MKQYSSILVIQNIPTASLATEACDMSSFLIIKCWLINIVSEWDWDVADPMCVSVA